MRVEVKERVDVALLSWALFTRVNCLHADPSPTSPAKVHHIMIRTSFSYVTNCWHRACIRSGICISLSKSNFHFASAVRPLFRILDPAHLRNYHQGPEFGQYSVYNTEGDMLHKLTFKSIRDHCFHSVDVGAETPQLHLLALARFNRQRIRIHPLVSGNIR